VPETNPEQRQTQFLTPEELVTHFQLDTNKHGRMGSRHKNQPNTDGARNDLAAIWRDACASESYNKGYWDKIQAIYGYTARASSDLLDERMYEDVVAHPT